MGVLVYTRPKRLRYRCQPLVYLRILAGGQRQCSLERAQQSEYHLERLDDADERRQRQPYGDVERGCSLAALAASRRQPVRDLRDSERRQRFGSERFGRLHHEWRGDHSVSIYKRRNECIMDFCSDQRRLLPD